MSPTEYPELLPKTQAILTACDWDDDRDARRDMAAVLHALAQQFPLNYNHLTILARNLHNPRPPAPTLAEAREAARQLGGPSADIVHRFLDVLDGLEGGRGE